MNFSDYQTALRTKSFNHVPMETLSLDDFHEFFIPYPTTFIPSLIQEKHYLTQGTSSNLRREYKHSLLSNYVENLSEQEVVKLMEWWIDKHPDSAIHFMIRHVTYPLYEHVDRVGCVFLRKHCHQYAFDLLPFQIKKKIMPEKIELFFTQETKDNLIRVCQELDPSDYQILRPLIVEKIHEQGFSLHMLLQLAQRYQDEAINIYIHQNRIPLWHTLRDSEKTYFHSDKRLLTLYLDLIPFEHREILFYAQIFDRTIEAIINKDFPNKRVTSFRNFLTNLEDSLYLIPEKQSQMLHVAQKIYESGPRANAYFYDVFLKNMPLQNGVLDGFYDRKKSNRLLGMDTHIDPKKFFYEALTPWADTALETRAPLDLHF